MAFRDPFKRLKPWGNSAGSNWRSQSSRALKPISCIGIFLAAFVHLTVSSEAFAQPSDTSGGDIDGIYGIWATQGFGSKVRIARCGRENGSICGEIVWLWEPNDDQGAAILDANNPDDNLTTRPLLGINILEGFAFDSDRGDWRGGRIYNPEDGRSYRATIRRRDGSTLEVKGCAARIFCQTQIWRLASTVCSADADAMGLRDEQ